MVLDQIMTDFHRQLIRSERIRQRGTLRIALIIQMVHILQIRAISTDAHMQTVADLDRIDLASVDFTQLRDLLLQAGMCLVCRLRGTLTGTEIEAGQPIPAGLLTARDLVKTAFHIGSELVIHIPRELRFQQFDHGEREPRRNQRTTALIHVPAIDNRGNNARIRGRAADFLLFQRFHKRRFSVTRRRLSFVSVGTNRHRSERIARIHRRQRHIVIRLLIRFAGFAGLRGLFNASSNITLLRFGERSAALTGRLHKAGELDNSAGSLEHGFPVRFGRRGQSHGRRGTGCVCHLAGKRALPDQRVQFELVGRHFACDFRRVTEFRARRPDAFVGFLRACRLCGILFRRIRQIVFAEMLDDRFACGCDRLLRQRHRIGTHVGDIAVFVQSLRRTHGLTRAHAETIAGGLLQGGRGKRWNRTATVRLGFHRRDSKRCKFQCLSNRGSLRLVQLHDLILRTGRSQLAIGAEILGTSQTTATQRHHTRIERNIIAIGIRRLQRCGDIPIRGTHERHTLALALHDQTRGDGLHTARGKTRPNLAPQHRRKLIAVQAVQNTAGFLGVDHVVVNVASIVKRRFDGFLRDFVEHHALNRHFRLERLYQMPGDGLSLAILIGCEVQGVGFFQRAFQLGHGFLLVAVDDVVRLESVFHVNAELAEFGFVGGRHLARLRKISNMADRGHHRIFGAQIPTDFLGLGGRLHNHELAAGSHSHSLLLAFATQ